MKEQTENADVESSAFTRNQMVQTNKLLRSVIMELQSLNLHFDEATAKARNMSEEFSKNTVIRLPSIWGMCRKCLWFCQFVTFLTVGVVILGVVLYFLLK